MASTCQGLAARQLRVLGSSSTWLPSSSSINTARTPFSSSTHPRQSSSRNTMTSARSFSTSTERSSAWPAGASRTEEQEENADGPSGSTTSPSSSSSRASSSATKLQNVRPRTAAFSAASVPTPIPAVTISDLQSNKVKRKPITCLTAYDLPTALSIRSADIDLCLVGDSLANVALGHPTTQALRLDDMIHHCKAVMRGLHHSLFSASYNAPDNLHPTHPVPLVIADMPFGSTFGSLDSAVNNVVRLMQETGIDGVKIEGDEEVLPLVHKLTQSGILVMGHIGLQPQRVGSTSGYRVQGKTAEQALSIYQSALNLQNAGCFSIVLECIPTKLGEFITNNLTISTIGIGAGSKTDGQIVVMNDILGDLSSAGHVIAGFAPPPPSAASAESDPSLLPPTPSSAEPSPPKFVRNFAAPYSIGAMRIAAVQGYAAAVRDRSFPDDQSEGYKIKTEEWKAFLQLVEGEASTLGS